MTHTVCLDSIQTGLESNPSTTTLGLCDLEQVTSPSSVNLANHSIHTTGVSGGFTPQCLSQAGWGLARRADFWNPLELTLLGCKMDLPLLSLPTSPQLPASAPPVSLPTMGSLFLVSLCLSARNSVPGEPVLEGCLCSLLQQWDGEREGGNEKERGEKKSKRTYWFQMWPSLTASPAI